MPMIEEYLDELQRGPADLKNIGGRWGGAITVSTPPTDNPGGRP